MEPVRDASISAKSFFEQPDVRASEILNKLERSFEDEVRVPFEPLGTKLVLRGGNKKHGELVATSCRAAPGPFEVRVLLSPVETTIAQAAFTRIQNPPAVGTTTKLPKVCADKPEENLDAITLVAQDTISNLSDPSEEVAIRGYLAGITAHFESEQSNVGKIEFIEVARLFESTSCPSNQELKQVFTGLGALLRAATVSNNYNSFNDAVEEILPAFLVLDDELDEFEVPHILARGIVDALKRDGSVAVAEFIERLHDAQLRIEVLARCIPLVVGSGDRDAIHPFKNFLSNFLENSTDDYETDGMESHSLSLAKVFCSVVGGDYENIDQLFCELEKVDFTKPPVAWLFGFHLGNEIVLNKSLESDWLRTQIARFASDLQAEESLNTILSEVGIGIISCTQGAERVRITSMLDKFGEHGKTSDWFINESVIVTPVIARMNGEYVERQEKESFNSEAFSPGMREAIKIAIKAAECGVEYLLHLAFQANQSLIIATPVIQDIIQSAIRELLVSPKYQDRLGEQRELIAELWYRDGKKSEALSILSAHHCDDRTKFVWQLRRIELEKVGCSHDIARALENNDETIEKWESEFRATARFLAKSEREYDRENYEFEMGNEYSKWIGAIEESAAVGIWEICRKLVVSADRALSIWPGGEASLIYEALFEGVHRFQKQSKFASGSN